MNEEQRKKRRKKGIDDLYRAIGEFAVKFESVCLSIQTCIVLIFDRAGLRHQKITQILLAGLTADPLRTLFESLVAQTQTLNKKEHKILKNVLNRFQKLTEERNDILHSTWFIGRGNESTTDFSEAAGMKLHKNKSGAVVKSFRKKAEDFHKLSNEAEALAKIFQRLDVFFLYGYAIEKIFVVSNDGHVSCR